MTLASLPLGLAARHGPWVLIGGLVAGLALPTVAQVLLPWVPEMALGLLFLAVLRMEPSSLLVSIGQVPRVIGTVLSLQLVLPLVILAVAAVIGVTGLPFVLALILITSAPSIVGSPNMCIMMGQSPAEAMRMMVIGTALLPLTVIPVFSLLPELGGLTAILLTALKLFAAITITTAVGITLRRVLLPNPSEGTLKQLEGASAIALAVFVVGLMPAVSDAFAASPVRMLGWVAAVLAANFGLQIFTFMTLRNRVAPSVVVPVSIISGNRNIALFLVALPPEVTAKIMVFIGCYQIPMYLTPLVMRRVYRLLG